MWLETCELTATQAAGRANQGHIRSWKQTQVVLIGMAGVNTRMDTHQDVAANDDDVGDGPEWGHVPEEAAVELC